MLVVTELLSIASEKVTVMLSVIATELWLSAVVETEDTVGAVVSVVVVSTTKVVTARVLLAFPSESVTIIVQSE